MSFSFEARPSIIRALQAQALDCLVIGGGATGAAVARDAALRGLKVGLLEANDFASATSSGSTKLFHGGIRYLENFEFKLVFEAIREREKLTKLYSPFVKPLKFVFPTYRSSIPPLWKLNLGLHLYDSFSFFHQRHQTLRRAQALKEFPLLKEGDLTGACIYTDSFAEDYRIVIELIKSAQRNGALCLSRARVQSVNKDSTGGFHVKAQDVWNPGSTLEVQAHSVFNCSGPFSDSIRAMLGKAPTLKLTQGIHIIVSQKTLPIDKAYVFSDPKLRRILFAIPWGSITYLGTTDTSIQKVEDARTHSDDVDYVLKITNSFFRNPIQRRDVIQSWAAVRPLIQPRENVDNSQISREHQIDEGPEFFFDVLGGKLTSHRLMAEDALHRLEKKRRLPRTKTHSISLQDHFVNEPRDSLERRLYSRYGRFYKDVLLIDDQLGLKRRHLKTRPEYLESEVHYSIRHEMALDPLDFIRRRSSLYYETQWQTDEQRALIQELASIFSTVMGKPLSTFVEAAEASYEWDGKGLQ